MKSPAKIVLIQTCCTLAVMFTLTGARAAEDYIEPDRDIDTYQIIRITNLSGLEPAKAVIQKGTTVIWINEIMGISVIHFTARQVTRACKSPTQFFVHDDGMFMSRELPQGAVASLCIIAPGTYDYIVRRISDKDKAAMAEPLPLMGTIIVE